jgi:hypothetical protein
MFLDDFHHPRQLGEARLLLDEILDLPRPLLTLDLSQIREKTLNLWWKAFQIGETCPGVASLGAS